MLLEIKRITVPPGQRVLLSDVSWQELEIILEDLGDRRASRVAYDNGTLEIMTPMPEHEINKELVSDLARAMRYGAASIKLVTSPELVCLTHPTSYPTVFYLGSSVAF